jgi:uncharacterized protein YheU (UPF0270 family)
MARPDQLRDGEAVVIHDADKNAVDVVCRDLRVIESRP